MARTRMENGKSVPLTPEEETARDAEEAAEALVKPLKDWKRAMGKYDIKMPRISEDIIDNMESEQFDKLPKIVRDNHTAKKVLRGQKP